MQVEFGFTLMAALENPFDPELKAELIPSSCSDPSLSKAADLVGLWKGDK